MFSTGDIQATASQSLVADYTINLTSNILTITDDGGNGELLEISQWSDGIRFHVPGRTYSFNGGAMTSFPFDHTLTGLQGIEMNAGAGNDVIEAEEINYALPNLTINGGEGDDDVFVFGFTLFQMDATLDIDLQNDLASPGSDRIEWSATPLTTFQGTGSCLLHASKSIKINQASIHTVDGHIILSANQQIMSTSGNFKGVEITGSELECTGSGWIMVNGKGGDLSDTQAGVVIQNFSHVKGGISGFTIINGTGGSAPGMQHVGVYLTTLSSVTSHGSSIIVVGQGGGMNGAMDCHGVRVDGDCEIKPGGTGSCAVSGTGSNASYGNHHCGVMLNGGNNIITSNDGQVDINGYGGGGIDGINCHGVEINSAIISAGGYGSINLSGVGGEGSYNSINNHGIRMSGATITSSSGNVSVFGSATAGFSSDGIQMLASYITAGLTGEVNVLGVGAPNGSSENCGIVMEIASTITSSSGNVTVSGFGGNNLYGNGNNHGVFVRPGCYIKAGIGADILVTGTGGNSVVGSNHGVHVQGEISTFPSPEGNVTVFGTGGNFGINNIENYGVCVSNQGRILCEGSGTVYVTGNGGQAGGLRHHGIYVTAGSSIIRSLMGNIILNGHGGGDSTSFNSSNHVGILIDDSGKVETLIAGSVNMIGYGGYGGQLGMGNNHGVQVKNGGSVVTAVGDIQLEGYGGGTGFAPDNDGIRLTTCGPIYAGVGSLMMEGHGGPTEGNNNTGIQIEQFSFVYTWQGDLIMHGFGGGIGESEDNYGVWLNFWAGVEGANTSGNVEVQGIGGLSEGNYNHGIVIAGDSHVQSGPNSSQISIDGTGGGLGNSNGNCGLVLQIAGKINAPGTSTIQVNAYGGNASGTHNHGVHLIDGASEISGHLGKLTINANGGGDSSSGFNNGILIENSAKIQNGNGDSLIIHGAGGAGMGGFNMGVNVSYDGMILTNGAKMLISGSGGGTDSSSQNIGISISDFGEVASAGTGNIRLIGNGQGQFGNNSHGIKIGAFNGKVASTNGPIEIIGTAEGEAIGIYTPASSLIQSTSNATVTLRANSMSLGGQILTTGSTILIPLTNGIEVELGTTGDPVTGPLQLTDGELDFITTGTLQIGDANTGTITINNSVTRSSFTHIELRSMQDIIFNGGLVNTAEGNLLIDPGAPAASLQPLYPYEDVIAFSATLMGDLKIVINGWEEDIDYSVFKVAGDVFIESSQLIITGTYAPGPDEIFRVVNNRGSNPIYGTFIGLAEGDTIQNFLVPGIDGIITYEGGDGNDAVIHTVNGCIFPDIPSISATPGTICSGQPVTLMITSGNLNSAIAWHWYSGSCGSTPVGTGVTINVNPTSTTTYYVRGEGGCVMNATCAVQTIVVNPNPNPAINHTFSNPCYYTNHYFQPVASIIPGATYQWNFGANAVPANATGYGPHVAHYTAAGSKSVKLVIHPNAPGAQCPDSSSIMFTIDNCPGQILGRVVDSTNMPIVNVNVKLFVDADANGIPDSTGPIRNIFTSAQGTFSMATLIPRSYLIIQTQPNNWVSFDDGDLTPDGDVLANIDSLDNRIPASITINKIDSNNVFVEIPSPGSITGNVFDDLNSNQVPDPGEGINNATVRLFADANANGVADSGIPLVTTATTASGAYAFLNMPTGHYVIVETTPVEFISIMDYDPTEDGDLVPNTNMNNDTLPVTLLSNESDSENFFMDGTACSLIVTNTNDSGYGSLRHVVDCAENGDTIRFHINLTGQDIMINSEIISFIEQLVLLSDLSPRVTIASEIDGLFEILQEANVEFVNVDIISGLGAAGTGAAFENHGILKFEDVGIWRNPLIGVGAYLIRNYGGSNLQLHGECAFYSN